MEVMCHAVDNYFHFLTAVESQDGIIEAEEAEEAAEAEGKKRATVLVGLVLTGI